MRVPAFCLLAATIVCARVALAEEAAVSPADHRAIEQVITSQLDAFRRDAAEAAFGYASPEIQAMFGDAPHFMAMVRQGYPSVYRSRSSNFEGLEAVDGRIVQHVLIVGPDGAAAEALYTMEREADGRWRIAGCLLLQPRRLET